MGCMQNGLRGEFKVGVFMNTINAGVLDTWGFLKHPGNRIRQDYVAGGWSVSGWFVSWQVVCTHLVVATAGVLWLS
jgi:hypothetical protein